MTIWDVLRVVMLGALGLLWLCAVVLHWTFAANAILKREMTGPYPVPLVGTATAILFTMVARDLSEATTSLVLLIGIALSDGPVILGLAGGAIRRTLAKRPRK